MQSTTQTYRIHWTILIAILCFASLAHFSTDIYVPAMPMIVSVFNTSPAMVQLTLAVFMLGYSLAHLFYGPWSDRVGRRLPMLFGIGLSVLGTAICVLSPSAEILILGRFIQGVGVAVCNSVGRTLVRDLVSGTHLARIGSYLGMMIVLITAMAPTIGGYIQHYFDWRAIFIFLLLYTGFIWIYTWKVLPETHTNLNPNATQLKTLLKNYWIVISNKTFLGYSLCVTFAYSGIIAYVTYAPFLFQDTLGLTPVQFGWLSFIIGGGIFLSFLINSQVVLKIGIEKMLLSGIVLMIAGGLLMLTFTWLHYLNVISIMLPTTLYCIGIGLVFTNGSAGAFQPLPHVGGSVGALYGFLQVLGGATASALMTQLEFNDQLPLALLFTILGVLSLVAWKCLAMKS